MLSVATCNITWRAFEAVIDGVDPDSDPDVTPIEGVTVTFTPSVSRVIVADPPQTIFLQQIVATTNSEGYLVSPDGLQGVKLVASDAEVSPTNFTYSVSVKTPSSASYTTTIFAAAGTSIDLSTAIPAPPSSGTDAAAWFETINGAIDTTQAYVREAEGYANDANTAKSGTQGLVDLAREHSEDSEWSAIRAEDARDKTEAEVVTGLTWTGVVSLTQADAPRLLHATLTGDVTLTLPTPASNRAYTVTLLLKQDATGGRTVKVTGGLMSWAGAYVHTGDANSVDMVHLLWSGTNWIVLPGATNLGIPASWVV